MASSQRISLYSNYKLSLLVVFGLTSFSLLFYLIICFAFENLTTFQKDALDMLDWIIKIGFGAIVGLIGGKDPD